MTTKYIRKLASIQKIEEIKPIPDADRICAHRIGGWWIVDQVGKYAVGDLVVYTEIDSFLPNSLAPFLSKGKEPRLYNGVLGERLRTVKLKKQISQGLLLPLSVCDMIESELMIGLDVSFPLGIIKWEPPEEFICAAAKGNFPDYARRSDQERLQNCFSDIQPLFETTTWTVSEKVEGQSASFIMYNGEYSVCSRNLNLKDSDNTFWNTSRKYDIETKLRNLNRNIQIIGEQTGPGISGNIYKDTEYRLWVFDIFDIDNQKFLSPSEMTTLANILDLNVAPILSSNCSLVGETCDSILLKSDGKSVIGTTDTMREGLVYKANTSNRISWKAVSNKYLLKS